MKTADPAERALRIAFRGHVWPFVAWLLIMAGLNMDVDWVGPPGPWKYAVRTVACAALFLALRPWRYYPALRARNLGWAAIVGVGVFILWVAPESRFVPEAARVLYDRFFIWGPPPTAAELALYDPARIGWGWASVRLIGSAFVIATIEEFFWRGFLYRRLIATDFTRVPIATWSGSAFLYSAGLFAVEHNRWLAGFAAGAAYWWVYRRTGDLWAAVIAHVLTNLLLGLYVLKTGAFAFW